MVIPAEYRRLWPGESASRSGAASQGLPGHRGTVISKLARGEPLESALEPK
jgi:hypothetical protein